MKNKTQRELNLEYWGRVYDMCDAYNKQHGTNTQHKDCVRYHGDIWESIHHPVFNDTEYSLAVAIIDDTPVFVGDKIYHKAMKHFVTIIEGEFYDCRYWTLTPPKPQRTFELNGQQLPCPSEDYDENVLELFGEYYYFESMEDRNKVAQAINILFNNARAKA
jgi:hypothetical protein